MTSPVFFAMREHLGGLAPMTFNDEFVPGRDERSGIVYACKLPPAWRGKSLTELAAEYEAHKADGTLPPSVMKARR